MKIKHITRKQPDRSAEYMRLEGDMFDLRVFAFSSDSKLLATANPPAGTLRIWDVTLGTGKQRFETGYGDISALAFSHDSKQLASTGWNQIVRVWDIEAGSEVMRLGAIDDGELFQATFLLPLEDN